MTSTSTLMRQSSPTILPSRPITFHRPSHSVSSAALASSSTPQRHDGSTASADPRRSKPVSAPSSPHRRAFPGIDAMSPLEELNGFRLGPAISSGPLSVSMDTRPDAPLASTKKSPMSRRRYLRIDSDSDGSSGSMTATPNRSSLQRSGSSGYVGANGKARTRNRTRSATSSPTTSSLRLAQDASQYAGSSAGARAQTVPSPRPTRHSMITGEPNHLANSMQSQSGYQRPSVDQQNALHYRNSRSQPDLPSQARSSPQTPAGSFPSRGTAFMAPTGQANGVPHTQVLITPQQRQEMAARKAALEQWHEHSLWMLRNFGQGQAAQGAQAAAISSNGNHVGSGSGQATSSGSVGRRSPLRQSTMPNLDISPLPSQSTLGPGSRASTSRPLSSVTAAADFAAASVLGFNPPPPVQVSPRSLPASRRTSPVESGSRPVVRVSPERPTISPPPYTAASSPGEESLSPTISDDGTADDPADVGVMFTTRNRRRRGDASAGETSGDGGASSPGDGIFPSSRGRQPYANQKSRRGHGWAAGVGASAYISAGHRGNTGESESSALGLHLGRLEIPSGDESRFSGDRGNLTTDNEDTLFSPKAPRIASAYATESTKGRLEDPSLPLVLFILRLLAAVPAAIGCIRLLYGLRAVGTDPSSPTAGELLMSIPWAILTGLYCFDMTTGLTRRWLLYYDLPSTLLRLVSLQTICWPCTAITLRFLGHRQTLAGWVLVGTCTAWSRSVQLWVTSNVPDHVGKNIKGSSRQLSFSSKSSAASLTGRKSEGAVTGQQGKSDWSSNTWQTGSNGARIFIKRRTWDWEVVSRKVAWKLGLLYLLTTWYLLLR